MARRRLTPAATDVPRAEHFLETKAFPRQAPSAPIARQAAEAAGAAALAEMAETLVRARETGRMVLDLPLDAIAPDHLARDRVPVEDAEMAALRDSIRANGQRTPIEVTPLTAGAGAEALPYGLISGWRRLAALKALHAETGEPRFATVQALVRRPETAQDAYVTMVEENELRVGLSHYERARVAALAARRGVFESEKKALQGLFATASRAKRSRIGAFLDIYHALDGTLRYPTHLPERLGLKLVDMVRAGQGARIAAAVDRADPQSPEAELAVLSALVAPPPKPAPGRSAPIEIRPGVTVEETFSGRTLNVRIRGSGVTSALRAEVRAALLALGELNS